MNQWVPFAPLEPIVEQIGCRLLAEHAGVSARNLMKSRRGGWVTVSMADRIATRGLGLVPFDPRLWPIDWFDPFTGQRPPDPVPVESETAA